jgi:hypothetical protein
MTATRPGAMAGCDMVLSFLFSNGMAVHSAAMARLEARRDPA